MKGRKISVVVPVYNGEKTLRRCLDSVLNQTCEDYEVIVVNNNSTDRTKEIIKGFQNKDSKIKYIFESNKGRGSARNAGISNSRGDIIAMTDADCRVPRTWLEQLTVPIIYENESAVMGGEKNFINNYWAINIQNANSEFLKIKTRGKYISLIDTKNFAIKSRLMKSMMFDYQLETLEDFDLYLRLKRTDRIRFDSSVVVEHDHKSSFKETVKLYFNRAYWAIKIYRKSAGVEALDKEPMLESISISNFLLFPLWIIMQFLTKPTRAYFIFVSEISWRAGIIWGIIRR